MKSSIALCILLAFVLTLGSSCSKTDDATTPPITQKVPVVNTSPLSNIGQTTSTSGGIISSDGGAAVYARGVCWSLGSNPRLVDYKTSDGAGTGSFTSAMTGLVSNYTYYVRAYATSSSGTGFGNAIDFTTTRNPTGPVVLNNGTPATWIATLTSIDTAAYSPLEVYIEQAGGTLTGTNRDNSNEVDVVTSGTVDGTGHVSLTATLSNRGTPRQTLVFSGTVTGSGSTQTISGTYTAANPTESGTFLMTHN
jgi:hypothetical protein